MHAPKLGGDWDETCVTGAARDRRATAKPLPSQTAL
jgi:hypothetical protein